jgi:hypothetical protein
VALITSLRRSAVPSVREPGDNPQPLEVVEVRPGVFLKLNAADRKAHEQAAYEEQRARGAWERTVVGAPEPVPEVGGESDLSKMSKADLVALAKQRDIDPTGNKPDLIERLSAPETPPETPQTFETSPETAPPDPDGGQSDTGATDVDAAGQGTA